MTAAHALDRAEAVLDGTVAVPPDQRIVAAAHLARSALEAGVTDLLADRGVDLRRAWVTSRLTVVQVLVGSEVGTRARLAWAGLSSTCHRHAFELPPADGEVRVLIGEVRSVIDSFLTEE